MRAEHTEILQGVGRRTVAAVNVGIGRRGWQTAVNVGEESIINDGHGVDVDWPAQPNGAPSVTSTAARAAGKKESRRREKSTTETSAVNEGKKERSDGKEIKERKEADQEER